MDNNSFERMLEINKRIEKNNVTPAKKTNRAKTQGELDSIIENFDKQVYGPTPEPVLQEGQKEKYDPNKEWKHLKEIEEHGRGSVNLEGKNIPKDILESILNNPLDLKPIDPMMDAMEERLKSNMSGIKAAANIFERVEKKDAEAKAKINENLIQSRPKTGSVDYDALKSIIEEVIDEKFSQIENRLNESLSHRQPYVPTMKMLNFKDNFYFVDNDNNVFECVMKYKGKRKKK